MRPAKRPAGTRAACVPAPPRGCPLIRLVPSCEAHRVCRSKISASHEEQPTEIQPEHPAASGPSQPPQPSESIGPLAPIGPPEPFRASEPFRPLRASQPLGAFRPSGPSPAPEPAGHPSARQRRRHCAQRPVEGLLQVPDKHRTANSATPRPCAWLRVIMIVSRQIIPAAAAPARPASSSGISRGHMLGQIESSRAAARREYSAARLPLYDSTALDPRTHASSSSTTPPRSPAG